MGGMWDHIAPGMLARTTWRSTGHILAAEQSWWQQTLEAVRLHPENAELWDDLSKAKAAVEAAWLEHMAGG